MSNTANDKEIKHKVRTAKVLPKGKRPISVTVEQALEEASKGLSADIIAWIKQQVESSIHLWIGENLGKIGISMVVDSNVIIQSMKYYVKGKTSILYHLIENPLFPLYAPKEAETEVLDYIENKTRRALEKKKLREAWMKLKLVLKIREVQNQEARRMAEEIIGKRDPADVPFVGLYIETGSVAILTNDMHYDSPSIRRFNIGELNDVVAVFHKGFFSFFIMNDIVPLVLEGLSKIVMAIAKVFYQFLKLILDICVGVITGAIEKVSELLSKIPSSAQKWIGIGLAVAAGVFMLLMIFHDGVRNKISSAAKQVWNGIKSKIIALATWLSDMIGKLIHYAELSAPYIGTSAEIFIEIHKHIIAMTEEIKDLKLENAANYV